MAGSIPGMRWKENASLSRSKAEGIKRKNTEDCVEKDEEEGEELEERWRRRRRRTPIR
jgi:hypothetical protein